jgi:transcription antitermination factor NusG
MRDLFAPKINGHSFLKPVEDEFRWVVGVFSGNGAVEVMQRAHAKEIKTYFPIKFNGKGEPVPLWRSYLFIEFVEGISIELCRTTSNFLKIISERDNDGILRPLLVKKDAISESLNLMKQGRYNDVTFKRNFYGKGSLVRVLEGNFIDMKVKLRENVTSHMRGIHKVSVEINGIRAKIELFKLSL